MRFSYDPRYNIAYLHFREGRAEVESIRLSEELIVDIAPDGAIYGIELLNANEHLRQEGIGAIVMVSEATGERAEISLNAS